MYSLQTTVVVVGWPMKQQSLYGPFATETEAKEWAKTFDRGGIPYTIWPMLGNPYNEKPWLSVNDTRV